MKKRLDNHFLMSILISRMKNQMEERKMRRQAKIEGKKDGKYYMEIFKNGREEQGGYFLSKEDLARCLFSHGFEGEGDDEEILIDGAILPENSAWFTEEEV